MDKALQLRVIAALQDKLSGPLNNIKGASAASAQGVANLRSKLKALESTQRDVGRFREMSRGLQSTRAEMAAAQQRVAGQGPMLPHDLPQFPTWDWLQFLARQTPARIRALHDQHLTLCQQRGRADARDATANRMKENYAALLVAWELLCEFASIEHDCGGFVSDLLAEMNHHIAETNGTRLPWVWIMEILLSELEAKRFEYPHAWGNVQTDAGTETLLYLRPNHVMDHLSTASHLRAKFDALPVKTGRIFKQQLMASGVVATAGGRPIDNADKVIRGQRTARLTAIRLSQLEALGLYATPFFSGEVSAS